MQSAPTPLEEINRKTVETLGEILLKYEQGKMSYEAYSAALDAIFGCVTGIVPFDTFMLLSQAQCVEKK